MELQGLSGACVPRTPLTLSAPTTRDSFPFLGRHRSGKSQSDTTPHSSEFVVPVGGPHRMAGTIL